MDKDDIPRLDVLRTAQAGTISIWTMSPRGADLLNEHYRARCDSPGSCGCGAEGDQQRWEIGTKRGVAVRGARLRVVQGCKGS